MKLLLILTSQLVIYDSALIQCLKQYKYSSKNNPKFSILLLNIPSLKSILFSNNDS